MISETYYKNSFVSRMTEAERQSLKSLLQQNKGGNNNINSKNKELKGKYSNNFNVNSNVKDNVNTSNQIASKFNFKPSENLARAMNRNTRNINNIQNGNKFAHLFSLNTNSIKKKVKSFSPS